MEEEQESVTQNSEERLRRTEGKTSRLQIVPWFSKKEWEETYHQAYSDNVELQEKAYRQMSIWKARYPNLPVGVECTMSMLHVKLCDKQSGDSTTYQDRDLQLLYSTAVMRFLNQLAVMSNSKDSMYKMAERNKIPDWLINLRHEMAHGNSVPNLYLVRQARDIILSWLQEHYWECEAEAMQDVIRCREEEVEYERSKITELLQLWLALKISFWAGKKFINNISDENTRIRAMELADFEGLGVRLLPETENGSMSKNTKKNKLDLREDSVMGEVEEAVVEGYSCTIKTMFDPLLRRLFDPLRSKGHRKIRYQDNLIDSMLNFKGFCPQIDLNQLEEPEVEELISLQAEMWKEVLEGLQAQGLLHYLLRALILAEPQLPTAHLWLHLITALLSGETPPHPPGTQAVCQLLADSLPCDVEPEMLLRKANLHHIQHQRPIELKTPSAKEIDVLQQWAHQVLECPSKLTNAYLHRLLGFWETPLSSETVDKLCALAQIFNGQNIQQDTPAKVYTVASLLDHGLVISEKPKSQENHSATFSPWQLYSGTADWGRCALGALPWQA